MEEELVLGVDGGGSKTVAVVGRRSDHQRLAELGRGRAGSSNLVAAGERAALAELEAAIRQACQQAGCTLQQMTGACLALAGSDRPVVRRLVAEWAQELGLSPVRIVHDAEPVLAAGSHDGCGIALISGTGSMAFGRNPQGHTARAGGWGPLLGDEGSGYWLSLSALRAVTRQLEGSTPRTELTDRLLEHLQVVEDADLPRQVAATDRAGLARLAHLVLAAAADQDPVADAIVRQGVEELAALVVGLARRLGWETGGFPLALSGGVLLNHPQLVVCLQQALGRRRTTPSTTQLVRDPVQGALLLASL